MWQKVAVHVEQPKITFNGKYFTQLTFESTKNPGQMFQYDYCSLKPIRDNLLNLMSPPSVAVVPQDNDRDGIVDQYNITMRIKKPVKDIALRGVNMILAFDYEVSGLIKMKMEGIAELSVKTLGSANINAGKIGT